MPYYIYHVQRLGILKPLGEHAAYADASKAAKQWRQDLALPAQEKVKVIFAESAFEAEDLLSQVRPAQPQGDD